MTTVVSVLGVDVGGTNTDAVIVSYPDRKVLKSVKVPTTKDFTSGALLAIQRVLDGETCEISSIMLGTTTFLNAAIQCSRELSPVTVLRICGPTSKGYPPFIDFPSNLAEALNGGCYYLKGGLEYDGSQVEPLDEVEVAAIADEIIASLSPDAAPSIVICGVFSSISHDQEDTVEDILREKFRNAGLSTYFITKSHEIAGIGLLEREGAATLNCALRNLAANTIKDLRSKLDQIGLTCDLFLTQNDGTLISCEQAMKFPIFTFNSGPTNSLRGAFQLAGLKNAIVVDIGGTSTDISVLQNGFPRPASAYVKVAGVRTNFRMPDTVSVGLGGGSIVRFDDAAGCSVGPASVGYKLTREAECFGGRILVATDIAVCLGYAVIEGTDAAKVKASVADCERAHRKVVHTLSRLVDKMKTSKDDIPLVLVGGGSVLIPEGTKIPGISDVLKPAHFDVANAVGATIAQVSAETTGVIDFSAAGHEEQLDRLKAEARSKVLSHGAVADSIELITDSTHLSYMPGRSMQVTCTALAELDLSKGKRCSVTSLKPMVTAVDTEPFFEDFSLVGDQETLSLAELPVPNIAVNGTRKEWIVSEADIHCMAIGAGILGTGGGGSPYLGTLETLQQLRKGKKLRIISHEDIPEQAYVLGVGYFGAPLIMVEKLGGALKHVTASRTLERYLTLDRPKESLGAFAPVEIGGCNSLAPLFVGAERDVPVVDCDFMGRAFPQYPMVTPVMYGENPAPVVLRDEKDNELLVTSVHNRDGPLTEGFLRDAVVRMGCDGGVVGPVLSKEVISRLGIHSSLSQIWKLGRDILEARRNKVDPLQVITETQGGRRVFVGKIVTVIRATEGGYNYGSLEVEGFDHFANEGLRIEFQNENLIARITRSDGGEPEIVATVPDLISLVDVDTYQPILTEDLRYGLRVSVLVLPAHPLLTTAQGLKAVGPKAFGYKDVEFKSCGTYVTPFDVFRSQVV